MIADEQIAAALNRITQSGGVDGAHHKQWVLDQVVRILTACPEVSRVGTDCRGNPFTYPSLGESDEYRAWIAAYNAGEDGPDTYEWDEGIPP